METLNKPTTALILGGVDLVLIGGLTVYTNNKLSTINSRLDKLEETKTVIKNDGEFIDSINDIYDRLEFVENENEKLKEKIARLEYITNKILFSLNSNNIPVNIEQNVRRMVKDRKVPSQRSVSKNSSKNDSSKNDSSKNSSKNDISNNISKVSSVQEDFPDSNSTRGSHDEDQDVLAAIEEARKEAI